MCPVLSHHRTGRPVLHVLPQLVVLVELADLRPMVVPLGLPLGDRGPIVQPASVGRAFRRSSREIVDGDRPIRRAISRTPHLRVSSGTFNDHFHQWRPQRHEVVLNARQEQRYTLLLPIAASLVRMTISEANGLIHGATHWY